MAMAEVSGCWRSGAHKLSAVITLRRRYHHLSAADELTSLAGSDRTHGVTTEPQVRGYSTDPLHRSPTAYYDILRVAPNATAGQIKTAYYRQSFIHHPDRNQNRSEDAAQLFALVAEAYSVLGDSVLRRKYDRGILDRSDVQSAGRPSASRAATPRRAPDSASAHFDFDAFYQAHYGEQLQKEQLRRYRREQMRRQQQQRLRTWTLRKISETAAFLMFFGGGILLINLRS